MQLYNSRTFGEFFQDTFLFAKENGKHYFKNYFITNGVFLLMLLLVGYFFSKFYLDVIFGGLINNNSQSFENQLFDNSFMAAILLFIVIIVALVAGVFSYSYTPIYLKLYEENSDLSFDAKDIIRLYKQNLLKLLIFILSGLLLSIPILIVAAIISFILTVTIIGMLLLPAVVAAISIFYYFALSNYLMSESNILESFSYAWTLMRIKLWSAIGSVGLFYLMCYIAQNIVIIVPYIFGLTSFYATNSTPSSDETQSSLTLIMLLVFFLSYIVSVILNNFIQMNHGIVYYSLKEENENINTKSIIDQIGKSE
ncbi:MAG: hypothetical protein PSN34_09780 [Urechidicola sp.]|nr:hypothetical protein [Urechidicola sp.]